MEPNQDSKQTEFARMNDLRLRHRRNRDEVSRWVISATEQLYASRSSRVKHDFCIRLGIAVRKFSLSRDGYHEPGKQYFRPQSLACVSSHPPDLSELYTEDDVDSWAEVWAINDKREPADQTGSADSLAAYLAIEFAQIYRIPAGSLCLAMLSGWVDR
jgi:hypothetical protein